MGDLPAQHGIMYEGFGDAYNEAANLIPKEVREVGSYLVKHGNKLAVQEAFRQHIVSLKSDVSDAYFETREQLYLYGMEVALRDNDPEAYTRFSLLD